MKEGFLVNKQCKNAGNQKNNMTKTNLSDYIPSAIREAIEFDKTYFKIPIKESYEKLVDVQKIIHKNRIKAIFNENPTATGKKRLFFLRESLVNPLLSAMHALENYNLFIRFEYMYRYLGDQKAAYERSVKTVRLKYPSLDKELILQIAGVFVASTPDTAAHVSGAALDVTLVDANLKPIDMGVPYIHLGPESATYYRDISRRAKKNRNILCQVMERNGFANYPYEYWHFSMGDKIAAKIQKKEFAIYGPIIYNSKTNRTEQVKSAGQAFDVNCL